MLVETYLTYTEVLGLDVRLEEGTRRFSDPVMGQQLLRHAESEQARRAAEERAAREEAAHQAAAACIAAREARLRAQGSLWTYTLRAVPWALVCGAGDHDRGVMGSSHGHGLHLDQCPRHAQAPTDCRAGRVGGCKARPVDLVIGAVMTPVGQHYRGLDHIV